MKISTVVFIATILIILVIVAGMSGIAFVVIKSDTLTSTVSDAGIFSSDCSYPWGSWSTNRCVDKKYGNVCYIGVESISCVPLEKEYTQ